MSNLLREVLNSLAAVGLVAISTIALTLFLRLLYRRSWRSPSRKRRAIRIYAQRLGRLLRARYGEQRHYTPAQVKDMMKEWGYSTSYDCYGLAMYCDCADFMDYHHVIGTDCNYEAMRYEISHCLSLTDATFSVSDVMEAGASLNYNYHHDTGNNDHHGHHDSSGHHDYADYHGSGGHHDSGGSDFGGHGGHY